ncbi:MAG: hydroxymethylglutaryl-CoA lyase [Ferrimicrobium sp.]
MMDAVVITDVTPRDGLQDATGFVPLEDKVALIEGLVSAGFAYVEATSFVHPLRIPMLPDGDLLIPRVQHLSKHLVALAPNVKGVERAVKAGIPAVMLVASASESHNQANLNRSRQETIAILTEAAHYAHAYGLRVRGAISTAFECPFEGLVPVAQVVELAEAYQKMDVETLNLADTIGTATPTMVKERIRAVREVIGTAVPMGLHLHDRLGWGVANIAIAYEWEVRHFESALGGLGGCPYAPGAAGNMDTERLVKFFEAQGIETGVDLDKLPHLRKQVLAVIARHLTPPDKDAL